MDVSLRELDLRREVRRRHPRRPRAEVRHSRRVVRAGPAAAIRLDIPASFDGIAKAGSLLGSAGIIVMDETTCMVWAAENLLHFYKHESCGKCTPCREGGDWLHRMLGKIERGEGEMRDLDLLLSIANNILGKTLCAFGDAAATPVLSTIKMFRAEYEAHIREGRCTVPAPWRPRAAAALAARTDSSPIGITPELIAQLYVIGVRTFFMLLNSAAVLVYMERKVAAFVQQRYGPYLVGPRGTAAAARRHHQADVQGGAAAEGGRQVPLLRSRRSSRADGRLCRLLGGAVRRRRRRSSACSTSRFISPAADVNVGLLVIFAITSMGVYGIVLAGWSSNSKYSLLGGLRSSAQMISYELSYGLSFAAVIMLAGSLSLREIVDRRRATGSGSFPSGTSSCSRWDFSFS